MRYGNPQPEAPTHLGSHQLPLPPEWLPAEELDDDDDGPTRALRARARSRDVSDSIVARQPTERSAGPDRPHPDDVRRESRRLPPTSPGHRKASTRTSAPSSERERQSFVASGELDTSAKLEAERRARRDSRRSSSKERRSSSKSEERKSASVTPSEAVSARGSDPAIDVQAIQAAQVAQAQQAAALAAMGAIDPLAVQVPPELGGPIYSWVRRLALQADLLGADKVLREAFTDLTSSLAVAIVYPGADGLWTLGGDDEIPKEATPLVAVAQARRAVIASHTALIPIVTSSETVAVVMLTRNPRNPAFHPIEQIAAVALARESAAVLHHLAVAHLQKASEIKADQGGLYRGEALEAHRSRGNEGVPVNLSPSWVRRAYPILVVGILLAVFGSIFVTVPTYSSGMGVVVLPGVSITAPTGGTVAEVLVKPAQHVRKGTILVRLHAAEQDAELQQAQKDADNATTMYLLDLQDDQIKKTLAAAITRVDREKARVESRIIRATADGTVSDIRIHAGALLQPGDPILQIVDPKAEPEMWAFLPGKDRPRLRLDQALQVEILGYTKMRDKAKLSYISPEVFGANEIAKIVGPTLADSIKLPPGSYVWVKAKLPSKTFKTQHVTYWYHHGMPAKTEVKIQSKPFLVTLLPALEKYIPD